MGRPVGWPETMGNNEYISILFCTNDVVGDTQDIPLTTGLFI